jgi:DNA-binding IclR family transcriptional regulator
LSAIDDSATIRDASLNVRSVQAELAVDAKSDVALVGIDSMDAYGTALGKILLAARPWTEVQGLIERHGWRPYTEQTIQDFDRLYAELATIREQGYAIDLGERRAGTVCLGAPIRDFSGEVIAALSVGGRDDRLAPPAHEAALPLVREAADRISFKLGHQGSAAYL